ncbi:MAG: leucine-rich repeat protein [Blautia marasmi]
MNQVTLPSSLTEIGNHAFAGVTGLTEVTIPESRRL